MQNFSEMPSTLDLMCSTDDNPRLPSALQDNNLETVYVANDGSYKHENGMAYMSDRHMKVVASMKMGQKILIVEDWEDINHKQDGEKGQSGVNIWLGYLASQYCTNRSLAY